jgi:hypothetical protein
MTAPYTAGGGGTHLEARVAASCLAAILCEVSVRGLSGDFATRVRSQRAAFGDPLDDLIIDGVQSDGPVTQLHLQVKNKLTFTANDVEWVEVLTRAWDTFSKPGFDAASQHLGIALGTYNARVDQHYQSVLNWAEHSTDAQHFLERIEQGDYSHQDKRSFVATVKDVLQDHAGRALTDEELWRLLKAFVIVHYDFQSEGSSRDEANAIDRIKGTLVPEHRAEAKKIWDHMIAKAGEMIPAGGGATRTTLVDTLKKEGFTVSAAPSFWKNIQSLHRESQRALNDIKSHIQGLKLHRAEAYQSAREALTDGRFVQIDGEPGTGKSALLKGVAEECARNGPIFVLKDTRIHPKGWSAHAHILGVTDDLTALLREFACAGEPILFIDGIDKVTDPAVHLTVNDILKTIANNADLAAWRVLVTIREQNLKHLETWLDPDALKKLPLRTIAVKALDRAELDIVADAFPRLAPLLSQSGGPDVILKRPFFLNALLGLAGQNAVTQLPATEVELLKLWWEMGGADRKDFSFAQHRRNLLIEAADAIARAPNMPISIHTLPPEPLEELKSAGVLRDKEFGHSVVFAHDIYEEWALCEFLIGRQPKVDDVLQATGEPDALIRPVQLLGAYALETNPTVDTWKALLHATGKGALRPVWQRAVLTSSLQSTRTTDLLKKLTDYLFDNDGERLRKLVLAMTTIEVLPNPLFLNEQLVPDLGPEERVKYAHLTAVPKPLTWVRFLDWLMPQIGKLPHALIPDLLPVFKTWQDSFAGQNIRHCRGIGNVSYEWLKEVEGTTLTRRRKDYRAPFGGALSGRDIAKKIRALFLSSAGDVPKLVAEYLRAKAADRKEVRIFRDEILKNCGALIRHLPAALVDFVFAAYLEDPDEHRDPFDSHSDFVMEQLGIAGHHEFYPASPAQPPFLALLHLHEDQALRLIHGLCNHSISIWRKARERGMRWGQPVTPIPITLTFPWGTQTFWGDHQVYLWFRGIWGNDAVESALMALEQWALARIDAGIAFETVFQRVIEGNESVAALGIGVSLCLAHSGKSLACSLPLVTCPYLWGWDIQRLVQENPPVNEMGNWYKDRTQLSAVRALNQKPHRKFDIRHLVPYFVFSGDDTLLDSFTKGVRSFPDRLPLSFEEEKCNAEHIAAMRKQIEVFAEQGDPQYFKVAPTKDGEHIQIWNEPPSLEKEEYKEQQERHTQLGAYLRIALWANKSLEKDTVDESVALDGALAQARTWDSPELFDTRTESFDETHRASAVAGAAYVVARHSSAATWTDERASWCLSVMERAATGPESPNELNVRSAIMTMHPTVFATHGYSALLARGYEVERCKRALLNLALDAVQGVQIAVVTSAKYYATAYGHFYWVLLDLSLEQCIVDRDDIPDFHSILWDEREAERKLALLDGAEAYLAGKGAPVLPSIPMSWIKADPASQPAWERTGGYARNDTVFLYDVAAKIVAQICLEPILDDPCRRAQFLALVDELLEWTFQEIVPPFAKSKRDHEGNTPFEWVFDFSAWCGKLCAHLTPDEARSRVVSRIWAQDTESALFMLQSVMRAFMVEAFLKPKEIDEKLIALWGEMAEWLFACPEWEHNGKGNHLDREFTHCAFTTLFCVAGDFSPLICGVDPGWPHLRKFFPIIERAVCEFGTNMTLYLAVTTFLKRGGIDLLPDPALAWLYKVVSLKKGDQKFWQMNGENTVELLKLLIAQKDAVLKPEHRKLITLIADILTDDGVRGAGFLQQELLRTT